MDALSGNVRECIACGGEVVGRKDKKVCSPECKRATKRAYDVARYPTIRAEVIERACAWQRNNVERKQAYDANLRANMDAEARQRKNEASRRYAIANPERGRRRQQARRAAKASNGVFEFTPRDERRALARSRNACFYCAGSFTESNPLEWDHIIPIVRGGRHSVGNLVPSCRECNRNKSIRFVTEWRIGRVVSKASLTIL